MDIHPSALIGKRSEIGTQVVIGPYAIIEDEVTIGDGARIGPYVFIGRGTSIGKRCRIFQGTVIGTDPQDLKYREESTSVEIGEDTVLREYVTIHRGTNHRKKTVIGKRNYLMAYSHVGHDCIIGDDVIMANGVNLGGHVVIGDFVNFGAMIGLHQFVHVGKHTFLAGGFRLVKDAPPYIMAGGEPMTFHGLNTVGLNRRGFTGEQKNSIKKAYTILYRSRLNVSQAVKKIQEEIPVTQEILEILDFVKKSERGIISAGSR
jgi:UDP-N-acetylglucosamine acyltransferase